MRRSWIQRFRVGLAFLPLLPLFILTAGCPGKNSPSSASSSSVLTSTDTPTPTDTPNATATAQANATATAQANYVATHDAKATSTAQVGATETQQAGETATARATSTPTPPVNATATVTPTPYPRTVWSVYSTLGQYGTDGVNGDFDCAMGVAVGAGYLAVGDICSENVQVFNSSGTYLYSVPPDGATPSLWGMTIDSNGELYVADYGSGEVDGYDLGLTGYTYDYTWSAQGNMGGPRGVKTDAQGNLVVADYSDGKIWNLSWADDSVLHQTTTGPSGGMGPTDVALDASGNLYVTDDNNSQVDEFNNQYHYTGFFNGSGWASALNVPCGVGVDSQGNLFISDIYNARVVYATPQGGYLGEIDGFGWPNYLVLDSSDDLFVVDEVNYQVDEYIR